jgi:hypothetical protein
LMSSSPFLTFGKSWQIAGSIIYIIIIKLRCQDSALCAVYLIFI